MEMKPVDAGQLSAKQLIEELERRGLKPTGFPADDCRLLQKAFDTEFEAEKSERLRAHAEAAAKRKALEEAQRLQRLAQEQQKAEDDALAADPRATYLLELIKTNATPVELCVRAKPTAIRALMKELGKNTSLRYLDLCNCGLEDDVGLLIGQVLRTNSTLQRLDLDHNKLGPQTIAAIADGIGNNALTQLKSLSLEGNPICGTEGRDISGLAAFSTLLYSNTKLLSLNFFQIGLDAEGGRLLAEAVRGNTVLRTLQLSPYDRVRPADLAAILEAIQDNAALAEETDSSEKAARAVVRRAAALRKHKEASESKLAAEMAWVEARAAERAAIRQETAIKREISDRRAYEAWEKEQEEIRERERLEEEAKKKKKEGKGKKKK